MKAVVRTECLPKEQRTAIRRACKDEMKNQNRRLLKLVCIALHEQYGFGRERLYRLIKKISELSTSRMDDPVYYIQDPYEKVPCWYFFSACDGIVKLPEEGTKIIAWKKIF